MALELHLTYPAQVLSGGADYPFGEARNVTVPGDGTGTPWEAKLVNDWLGYFQSLLVFTGTNPSNVSDKVGASQYFDAFRHIARSPVDGLFDLSNGSMLAQQVVTADGSRLGGSGNIFKPSQFNGVQAFDDQITVAKTGINIGSGSVTVGNGTPGLIIQVGGMRVQVGNARFDDTAEFHKEIKLLGEGRITKRIVYGPDSNFGFALTSADVVVAKGGVITAPRTYTILDAGASDGSEIEFHNHSGSVLTIKNQGGTTIGTVAIFGPSAGHARFMWEDDGTGSTWKQVG